jgi:zinc-ribbon domain
MYCPTCATQNGDGTKFCRACGTNLSLVPQAITGRLPEAPRGRRHRRDREHREPASLAGGITSIAMGLGFMMVAFALALSGSGHGWWFWMLIPAFLMLGKGVASIVTTVQTQRMFPPPYSAGPPPINTAGLPPQPTYETLTAQPNFEKVPPPSVTETTTRHLDAKKEG